MQMTFLFPCVLLIIGFQAEVVKAGQDDPPEWEFPSPSSPQVTLDLAADKACDLVTGLRAASGDGSPVNISFLSPSPTGVFRMNSRPFSGEKFLSCTKDSITETTYIEHFRATHIDGNDKYADLTVTIVVKGLPEPIAPEFTNPSPDNNAAGHWIYVPENIQAGDVLLTLRATDRDTEETAITFSMSTSPNATKELFEIDTGTDALKVKAGVVKDFFDIDKGDAVLEYDINLIVDDGALTSSLSTIIYIRDINDNAPVISGNFAVEIPENATVGYSILNVTATDNDLTTENNQVSLTLSGAPEFVLTGNEIVVAEGVNFSATTKPSYILNLRASDNAPKNPKSTDQEIIVNITAVSVGGTIPSNSGSRNNGLVVEIVVTALIAVTISLLFSFPLQKRSLKRGN